MIRDSAKITENASTVCAGFGGKNASGVAPDGTNAAASASGPTGGGPPIEKAVPPPRTEINN